MAEYSRLAKGSFVSTGGAQMVNLPFQPDWVEITNYSAANAGPAASTTVKAWWDANMGQGFAVTETYNASSALVLDTVTTQGISTFAGALALLYGPQLQIASISKASPAVVTTASAHGLTSGQIVILEGLYQSPTTGMPQIAGIPFVVTVTGATTFTIPWNTNQSNYTALSGSPSGAFVRQVLNPYLYAPGVAIVSSLSYGSTTTVVTTAPHNLVVGSEVAFRMPAIWGAQQLNSLPNQVIPGSPIYGYVISVTNSTTVVVNINSTGFQAFNTNPTVAQAIGLSFPQMVAIGDVNTGGLPISAGSVLYPSPLVNGFSTINGPAIQGAFVNATAQGFIVGAGVGTNVTAAVLVGSAGNVIYYRAYLHDKPV